MKKHLPLRTVFTQAADVLTAVCPCWMASPLSVSQLLDSGKQYFDFVIFDEASQVLPEDASPLLFCAGTNWWLPVTPSNCHPPLFSLQPTTMNPLLMKKQAEPKV